MEQRQFKWAALALVGLLAAAPLAADKDPNLDVQDSMEDLRSSLGTLSNQVNALQTTVGNEIMWNVNTDIRYDYQPYKTPGAPTAARPLATPYGAPNGTAGMYAKRVELEGTGKIATDLYWNLQFEFVGLKIEDTGFDYKNLSLLPYVSMPGYNWEIKVGLYRQPFGIENQTGSSSTPFPERAIMDGGANPAGYSKIVTERVMGLQAITSHSYGMFGYKIQAAVADNTSDQDPASGGFGGTYTNVITYPANVTTVTTTYNATDGFGLKTDQDPSEFGRLGLDINIMPKVVTLNLGGSALHNSANTVFFATGKANAAKQIWSDNIGADFTLDAPVINDKLWGEWVSQNKFTDGGGAGIYAGNKGPGSFNGRAEGWYLVNSIKPLAFVNADWQSLELLARIESFAPDVNAEGKSLVANAYKATSEQAATVGMKYYYAGKNYTSINYTAYALNGNYRTLGPASLFTIQQQFNY